MKHLRIVFTLFIIFVLVFNLCGCTAGNITSNNLMVGITPNKVAVSTGLKEDAVNVNNFSLELFKNSIREGENTLVSPLSVIYALGMTANGAKGETLKQIEDVLGMKTQDLNVFLYSFMESLKKNESAKLKLANSVWFTDSERFTVNKDFLQTNADYYGADIFKTPMDYTTIKDVNNWVKDKTDGMIKKLVDNFDIKANTVMCLLNALCFEGDWIETYKDSNVYNETFTSCSGKEQDCEFMHGAEEIYLENENSKGFVKPYKNSNFAFVALLPDEKLTIDNYLKTLDLNTFNAMMENKTDISVEVSIPKFENEFNFKANEILSKMGVTNIFDSELADFGGLGKSKAGNIWVETVKQKTFISVAEKGTRAGAATAVVFIDKAGIGGEKQVCLNRPFFYMIIDTNTNIPLFIGIQNTME